MTMNYRISAATGLHIGDREYQQDQVALLQNIRNSACILAVLADGMGGRSGGRKAADQVILTAKQLFTRFDPETDDPIPFLKNIVNEAHLVIRLTAISAEQDPHSTIAAYLIMPDGECHCVHSGDSRIYHFQQGRLVYRTLDHSYVQTLVERGEITPEQAIGHPHSNILVGCLGSETDPPASIHSIKKLRVGDALLVCSDGLWAYFSPQELAHTVEMLPPKDCIAFLLNKARERSQGVGDNISLALVKFDPIQDPHPEA